MSKELFVLIIIIMFCFFACFVITDITFFKPYNESENYCESIGMELAGWVPSGQRLTCRVLENEQVVKIKFEKVSGKYYPVKEVEK